MSGGLKVNDSSSVKVSKLYTGIENFCIIAVSPNQKQYKDLLNIEKKEEPKYISDKEGKTQVRIEFWLDNKDETNPLRGPMSYFLTDKSVTSKDGLKKEVINAYGSSTWLPVDGTIPEKMSWFDTTGMRDTIEGESDLTNFIKNYINHNSKEKDECQLDVKAYLKGDFTQLKAILSNNKVKVCCGIKQSTDSEGKIRYNQAFYSKVTERPFGKGDKIQEAINEAKNGGYLNNVYYGEPDFKFTEVPDPSKLAFFGADKPEDLMTKKDPAF